MSISALLACMLVSVVHMELGCGCWIPVTSLQKVLCHSIGSGNQCFQPELQKLLTTEA